MHALHDLCEIPLIFDIYLAKTVLFINHQLQLCQCSSLDLANKGSDPIASPQKKPANINLIVLCPTA